MLTNNRTRPLFTIVARLAAFVAGACLLSVTAVVFGAQGVIATGVQTDYGDRVNRNPGSAFGGPQQAVFSIDDLCNNSATLGMAMRQMVDGVQREMANAGAPINLYTLQSIPGAPNRVDIERDIANARDEVCNQGEPPTTVQPFTISYSSCRMSMYTPTNAMMISMPTGSNVAYMLLADHAEQEVYHVNLTRRIDDASQNPLIGRGWNQGMQISSGGQTRQIGDYQTKLYNFTSTGGLGQSDVGALGQADLEAGQVGAEQLGNLISVTSQGNAWIADDVPGVDIVKSFYQNLTSQVQPGGGTSFFGGLIKNQVSMLSEGMPIEVETTVSSKVMGRTMVSGKSKTVISNIRVVDLASDWCEERPLPEGYTETDLDEQMAQASAGTQSGSQSGAGSDAPNMADAMQQMQAAMDQMTPEQQEMMASLGFGGGATPSAGGAAASANAASQGSGAQSSGNDSAPRAQTSSAALTTDNLVESVQKHLAELGYNPGNTDGTASVMTEVAISQFQAEKGMPVTGKVTPQLLGVLAAAVDSR